MGRRKLKEAPIDENKKKLMKSFNKKTAFIRKKAYELSTLCDIPACVIIYGPNGDEPPCVWPEEPQEFNSVLAKYMNTSSEERKKRALNLTSVMPNKLKHDADTKQQVFEKLPNTTGFTWADRINSLSSEQLMGLVNHLNSKLDIVNSRIDVMKRVQLESEQQQQQQQQQQQLYHATAEEQKMMISLQQYHQNQDYLRYLEVERKKAEMIETMMNQGGFYNHNLNNNNNNMVNGFPICDPTPLACYGPGPHLQPQPQPQPHQSYTL